MGAGRPAAPPGSINAMPNAQAPAAVSGPVGGSYAPLARTSGVRGGTVAGSRPQAQANAAGPSSTVALPDSLKDTIGGVGSPTPEISGGYAQRETRNVNTSGAFRQEQTQNAPWAPTAKPLGPAELMPQTPFLGTFTPAGPLGAVDVDRDQGGDAPAGSAAGGAPMMSQEKKTAATAPPSRPGPLPAGPIETKQSALVAAPGSTDKDGNPVESGGDDTGGDGFTNEQIAAPNEALLEIARRSGEDYNTILALYEQYGAGDWQVKGFGTADDGSGVRTWERWRYVDPSEVDQNGWRDPKTGKVYEVLSDGNGRMYVQEEGEFDEATLMSARKRGETKGARGPDGRLLPKAPDERQMFLDAIKEIAGIGSSDEDKRMLQEQLDESQQRYAYETGRSQLAGMEAGARAGLSADASAGMGSALALQGGVAAAQDATQIRLKQHMQVLQSKLQALQMQAAFAANATDRQAAHEMQKELMKAQAQIQRQLMAYQDKLNTPSFGEALGGAGLNLLGGLGDLATFGLASKLFR